MKTVAVIAEYNPFHKGHEYQLSRIRKELGADNIIIIMSGNYVQRGEPAFMPFGLRTKAALQNGADIVIKLPVCYATQGADLFAYSAVSFLERMHVADELCFSAENSNLSLLTKCAEDISNDNCCSSKVRELMGSGLTFAAARAELWPDYSELLNKPNNILALEYIKSLKALNSSIKPVVLERIGSNYNDREEKPDSFASAGAIRKAIISGDNSIIRRQIPENFQNTLCDLLGVSFPVTPDDFSEYLYYAILSEQNNLKDFVDVNANLADKIINKLPEFTSFETFTDILKSKELTRTRISRALLHIMLKIKGSNSVYKEILPEICALQVLGINKNAGKILSKLKQNSEISLIGKIPAAYKSLNETTRKMFDNELYADTLYSHVISARYHVPFVHEYSKPMEFVSR